MSLEARVQKRLGGFCLDVTLYCAKGETLALLGASGSGKTLTLNCIAGVVKPDAGYVTLDGDTLYSYDMGVSLPVQKRGVGLLCQSYALFPNMTVEGNILCGLSRVKGRAQKEARLNELVESLRLYGLERLYPHELSGGQQQRVALARLMASEPRLLLLDEPFSAVDEALKWELEQELLDTLSRLCVPVVYVTHDMREVRRLCDRVCVLDGGVSEAPQTPSRLFERPLTIAAARLAGCENVLKASLVDSHALYTDELGMRLVCASEAQADTKGAAIRASGLRVGGGENEVLCTLTRVIEDEGRLIAMCKASATGAPLRAALTRDELCGLSAGDSITLHIPPDAISPLR